MRTSFILIMLMIASALHAQDTTGTIKIKKTKIETGYLPGTWRMTYTEDRNGYGKGQAWNTHHEQGPFTLQLNENKTFKLTKSNNQEWEGKWEATDTLTIVLTPDKRYRKQSKSECKALDHKVWKIEDAEPGRLKLRCIRKEDEKGKAEVKLVKLM